MKITLKVLRVSCDLTQAEIAKKLGITPGTWSNWERGITFPDVTQIKKIEKLFNVGYSDINFLTDNTVKPYEVV